MKPTTTRTVITIAAAALVGGLIVALRCGAMPLGVRGEWEWPRLPAHVAIAPLDLMLGGTAGAGFAGLAAWGTRSLAARAGAVREVAWVAVLLAAAVAVQLAVQSTAPAGYGLEKWVVALVQEGSSGYYSLARTQAVNLRRFLAGYPDWVRKQDALHIGTHPPGLIATTAALRGALLQHPGCARFVEDLAPPSVATAWRFMGREQAPTPADRATIILTGALTLLACAATVVPLSILARAWLPPAWAFATAALWPLVPSAVLFQPTADTAFPLLATTALALAAHGSRPDPKAGVTRRNVGLALASGVILGLGMQLSLAFLAVGAVVGLLAVTGRPTWRGRAGLLVATGAGFFAVTLLAWLLTGGNPFATWWWNQANHARFYVEYHRSYRAWLVANPVELAVGLGLPATVWALVSLRWPGAIPRVSVATLFVLFLLTVSGRNLSEVGRLWLPLMPALLVAAGRGFERLEAGPATLAAAVGLMGAQTLALQAMIQVVYPV